MKSMTVHTVIDDDMRPEPMHVRVIRLILGLLMLVGGALKVAATQAFATAVIATGLPDTLQLCAIIFIPLIEILIGAFLLFGYQTSLSVNAAIVSLLIFTTFIVLHLGSHDNCGCYGDVIQITPDRWAVYKNVAMIIALLHVQLRFRRSPYSHHNPQEVS